MEPFQEIESEAIMSPLLYSFRQNEQWGVVPGGSFGWNWDPMRTVNAHSEAPAFKLLPS